MHRQRYLSHLAEALWRRNLWMAIALLLAVANSLLAYGLATRPAVREKTIVLPPSVEKTFWVHGDTVAPEYLEQMALWFADLALTYNPETIAHRVKRFLRHADPTAYGALAARLEADAAKVKRQRLSSVFYPQSIRIEGDQVALTGQLVTLVGSKETNARQATFRMSFAYRHGRLFVLEFQETDHAHPFGSRRPA
jgi:conjugal transfer pilus assembly protein TraE